MKTIAVISDGLRFQNFASEYRKDKSGLIKIYRDRVETQTETFIKIYKIEDCLGRRFNGVICLIDNQRVEDEVNKRLIKEVPNENKI